MRTRARGVLGGAALVLLIGGGATAYAATTRNDSASYRLASVSRGEVQETLTSAGTVDRLNRADVTFQTSGTVAKVSVSLGQRVTAGQVLTTLDATDARADLDAAQATLAKARAQLVSDESAQSSAVSSAQSASSTSSAGSSGSSSTPGTQQQSSRPSTTNGSGKAAGQSSSSGSGTATKAVSAALARLAAQQKAVTSAQSAVTRALDDAAAALTTQTQACTATDTSASTGTGASTGAGTGPSQACQDALSAVQGKQQAAKTAEQTLSDALTSLTTTLSTAVKATQEATQHATLSSAAHLSASSTIELTAYRTTVVSADDTTTSGSGSGQQQSQTVTAATLAKDQAAIDTGRAGLIEARRSLAATVVRSPITGTVASLDLSPGDSAATGDTAAVITNGSALLVDTTVSEAKIREITVGQPVVVSVPGSSTTSAGTVSSIGVTADSDSSTVSYPVTVEVRQPSSMLGSGSSVVLRIVTDSVTDVLTVPSSAVTTTGTRSTVRVRNASGTVTATPVTLGAVGTTRTQVKRGLQRGQQVVLADLDQTITGASTSVDTAGSGRAGGPGGGTGGPGGGGGQGGPPGAR